MVGAIKKKKADSAAKKSRRKYKQLEEEKAGADAAAIENSPREVPEQSSDTRHDTSSHPSNTTAGSSDQSEHESQRGSS